MQILSNFVSLVHILRFVFVHSACTPFIVRILLYYLLAFSRTMHSKNLLFSLMVVKFRVQFATKSLDALNSVIEKIKAKKKHGEYEM